MAFSPLLEELLARQNLTDDKITYLISETMHGRLTPVQIAAWLMALRMKGETPGEIAACARLMREIATPIERSALCGGSPASRADASSTARSAVLRARLQRTNLFMRPASTAQDP